MRRFPFVALFVHFPVLWLATFKAHIAARISGTIQTDLARDVSPNSLLRERLDSRVVAELGRWRQRLFCDWVQRQTAFVYPLRCTLWCVRAIYRILPLE